MDLIFFSVNIYKFFASHFNCTTHFIIKKAEHFPQFFLKHTHMIFPHRRGANVPEGTGMWTGRWNQNNNYNAVCPLPRAVSVDQLFTWTNYWMSNLILSLICYCPFVIHTQRAYNREKYPIEWWNFLHRHMHPMQLKHLFMRKTYSSIYLFMFKKTAIELIKKKNI